MSIQYEDSIGQETAAAVFEASKKGWYQIVVYASQHETGLPKLSIFPADGRGQPRSFMLHGGFFGQYQFATSDPHILRPQAMTGILVLTADSHIGVFVVDVWLENRDMVDCSNLIKKISFMGEIQPTIRTAVIEY